MSFSADSPRAIRAVDQLLEGKGLVHARRKTRHFVKVRAKKDGSVSRDDLVQRKPARAFPKSQIEIIRIPGWTNLRWLDHGFSTRTGGTTTVYRPGQSAGELNLGYTASDEPSHVDTNRERFVNAVSPGNAPRLSTLKQIHSSLIRRVGRAEGGSSHLKGDGLLTDEPGVLLGVQTADCIPVLIADTRKRAVGAFHAGWRGTLARIVENGVGRMRLEFGSHPEDLVAAVGPGIAQCCYAVGEEVRSQFVSQFHYSEALFREVYDSDPIREKYPLLFMTQRAPGHSNLGPSLHLNLMEANRRQLLDAGLRAEAIHLVGDCTSCRTDRYFSHRAEHGFTGRMLSVIGVRRKK